MKPAALVLVFIFAGSFTSARADVIFDGTVSLSGNGFPACSQQGVAVGSISLSCTDSPGYNSNVSGSGAAFSGQIGANISTEELIGSGPYVQQIAQENIEAQLSQGYVLTGGTGNAAINFDLVSMGFPAIAAQSPGDVTCSLLGIIASVKCRSKSRQNVWLRAVGMVPGQGLAKRLSFPLELVEQFEICRTQGSM